MGWEVPPKCTEPFVEEMAMVHVLVPRASHQTGKRQCFLQELQVAVRLGQGLLTDQRQPQVSQPPRSPHRTELQRQSSRFIPQFCHLQPGKSK